jgi:hypothetical protein
MVDEDGFSAEAQLEKEGMRGPAEDFVWARKGWTERSVTTRSKDKNRVRKREGRTAGGRGIGRHGGKRARKGMLQYGKDGRNHLPVLLEIEREEQEVYQKRLL